nr:glutathione peroxidase isoform 1 [Halisarca dujardinii]
MAALHYLCLGLALVFSSVCGQSNVYSFTMKDIHGHEVPLKEYSGKVLLIVNVACLCGYTDGGYRELIWLQNEYASKGLEVLGFPCNQFGSQEPWPESEIHEWVSENYQLNFQLFSKVTVFGDDAHPLYRYLSKEMGRVPTWNFAKYIVNRAGKVVKFFPTTSDFQQLNDFLERMFANERTDL